MTISICVTISVPISIPEMVFYFTVFLLYCSVGLLILINAYKGKKSNVYYLAFNIITNGVTYFIVFLSFAWVQYVLRGFGLILALMFTKLTFYQDKEGPYVRFLIFGIISAIIQSLLSIACFFIVTDIYLGLFFLYLADVFFALSVIISSGWFAYAAFEAHKEIKSLDLEPFQKKRYILFGTSGVLIAIDGALFFIFMPAMVNYYSGLIIQFIIAALVFVFIILNYLAWVAPQFYRNRLNKGYKITSSEEIELSEEELMKKLASGGT